MSRRGRILLIVAIVLFAIALRALATRRLTLDFDEPVYITAGLRYAEAIRAGDLSLLASSDPAPEHPGLVKLLYAAVILRFPTLPEGATPDNEDDFARFAADPANRHWLEQINVMILAVRRSSAFFGVLHVLLLALVNPVAGALLAVHTYAVKYTSQMYLEALPMFTATIAVLAYIRAIDGGTSGQRRQAGQVRKEENPAGERQEIGKNSSWAEVLPWWALSAVALGLTAAGKYVYAVAGLAIVADYLWRWTANRRGDADAALLHPRSPASLLPLFAWGLLALLVFFAANPYLWPDPIGRLTDSLRFHAAYSQGAEVARVDYPWWQPFMWLFTSQPATWHPGIIVTPLDTITATLGIIGLRPAWWAWGGRGRVIVLWWAIGLVFLLLWRTKWPQYSLIMTAPMCLCAAETLRWVWSRLPEEMWAGQE